MPIPEYPLPPLDDSLKSGRLACQHYVCWVQALLDELIHNPLYSEQFDPVLRELAQGAWTDVHPQFDDVAERLNDERLDENLAQHGLYGAQLRFKLYVVHRWFSRWLARTAPLRHLLKVVDDLLDSILAAVGAGGAISEFKKAVEESTTI